MAAARLLGNFKNEGIEMQGVKERLFGNIATIPFSGCWIWMGFLNKHGYGKISVNGKPASAHRVSYELAYGKSPKYVCHSCDCPSCVNPDHLRDGSHSENMRDREARGRANKATGERSGSCVHSTLDIEEMRSMRNEGFSLKEIAQRFGLKGTGYVCLVVNNNIRKTG